MVALGSRFVSTATLRGSHSAKWAALFQRDKSVISRHIKNVFDEGELRREAVLQILQQLLTSRLKFST